MIVNALFHACIVLNSRRLTMINLLKFSRLKEIHTEVLLDTIGLAILIKVHKTATLPWLPWSHIRELQWRRPTGFIDVGYNTASEMAHMPCRAGRKEIAKVDRLYLWIASDSRYGNCRMKFSALNYRLRCRIMITSRHTREIRSVRMSDPK